MKRRNRDVWWLLLFLVLAAVISLLSNPRLSGRLKRAYRAWKQEQTQTEGSLQTEAGLTVHYLDVEKCNCVLAESADGHFMLIDAGSNDEAHEDRIISYLAQQGVEKLDYLVITHPHRDHIYAVPEIVQNFSVEQVLMGSFDPAIVDTRIFDWVNEVFVEKEIPVIRPALGDTYELGNAAFTIIANDDSSFTAAEQLNDCSMGLILTDGLHRFLFYGDGEEEMEAKLLQSGVDLQCDVLMTAHHGSNSSSCAEILDAIQPEIAVIPCGIDGDGKAKKPSKKVLKRLEERGIAVYRSDENGTVVVRSTKDGLSVICEK